MHILDLFSGEGGAARGYLQAGHTVHGVDTQARVLTHYPGPTTQADALDYLRTADLSGYDLIHASPPCHGYSIATTGVLARRHYPRLIGLTRDHLVATGLPWVIENVEGARPQMRNPILLCGRMFGLGAHDDDGTWLVLDRHRLFETPFHLRQPPHPHPKGRGDHRLLPVGGVYGGGRSNRHDARFVRRGGYTPRAPIRAQMLGVDQMTQHGLSQAIPPVYTQWLITQIESEIR
jgi:DNA (cytosine-5)-methyltransferase 1